jgi:hypothetical protein
MSEVGSGIIALVEVLASIDGDAMARGNPANSPITAKKEGKAHIVGRV